MTMQSHVSTAGSHIWQNKKDRNMTIPEHQQGTEEWHQARLGKVTGSKVNDVLMGPGKAGHDNYLAQLVCERLTGTWEEGYTSKAMQDGKDREPVAVSAYEFKTGNMTDECGFIPHPTISDTGASPDRLIGVDGLLEVKCTTPGVHLKNLDNPTVSKPYRIQKLWEMECAERKWVDFVSYCPAFPPAMQCHIRRFTFEEMAAQEDIEMVRQKVIRFNRLVKAKARELTERFG